MLEESVEVSIVSLLRLAQVGLELQTADCALVLTPFDQAIRLLQRRARTLQTALGPRPIHSAPSEARPH